MKIAIDGRMYSQSGIGRYIRNLLDCIQKLDKKNEYYILFLKKEYDSLTFQDNFKKILADFKWYGFKEQFRLPKLLSSLDAYLVHFPHFNVPLFYRGKFIVTIHDLIHQHYQMRRVTTLDPIAYKIKQIGYKKVFKNAITKSAKILAPSHYVKDLLIKEWGVNENKIIITYEAVDNKLVSIDTKMSKEKINQVMEKFNINLPYIFYVGNAHPHKNVEGLIKAFLKLKKKYSNLSLVLSGYDHYFWKRLKEENKYDGIVYTGYVTDEELVALYKNASCFVMPSFEEGFGIPLLEAMICGCPVVSSNAGSLPEVGGNAALYFDPFNTFDVSSKIAKVLNSEKKRLELIEKGRERVRDFSWEELTKQTLEVYVKCGLQ